MHYFYNETPISPIFFRQFGLSIKEDGAIGQFGTGLKYAIAAILRGHGQITCESEGNHFKFDTRRERIRNRDVDIVTMNGEDLSFNTSLGKNWQPWMAFRELICNAWDEGGGYSTKPVEATTIFTVDWPEFGFLNLEEYFLFGNEAFTTFLESKETRIIRERPGRIYYKGIFVGKMDSAYGHILQGEEWMRRLTEDRVLFSTIRAEIEVGNCVNELQKEQFLDAWLELDDKLDVRRLHQPPADYMDDFARLYESGRLQSLQAKTAIEVWERNKPPLVRRPIECEQAYIEKCVAILNCAGIEVRWPIRVREHKHNRTMASTDGKAIYINSHTFKGGLRDVLKCFLEEITHLEYDTQDGTYAHQHALLNLWIRAFTHLTGDII